MANRPGSRPSLLAVGISHRTAPLAVREQLAFTAQEAAGTLATLGQEFGAAAVLSTCNRTEVYVSGPELSEGALMAALGRLKGLRELPDPASFYALGPGPAARHLFRVASGIDSMVVGEAQILGQVREALAQANRAGTLDGVLSRLLHQAIAAGKRARRETAIGRYALSVSRAAALQARQELGGLKGRTILIVSAGTAGKLTARSLRGEGARLLITSRTYQRAQELAQALGGEALPFAALAEALAQADVVISATGAGHYVLGPQLIAEAMARRPSPSLLLIDIAVPRDIDPLVRDVPGVRLFDIDDLQGLLRAPAEEIARVEAIVGEEAARFLSWWEAWDGLALVAALRRRAEAIRRRELERALARLPGLSPEERRRLEAMSRAIVNKLLHEPTARLRRGSQHLEAARHLFALDREGPSPEGPQP